MSQPGNIAPCGKHGFGSEVACKKAIRHRLEHSGDRDRLIAYRCLEPGCRTKGLWHMTGRPPIPKAAQKSYKPTRWRNEGMRRAEEGDAI